MNIKAIDEMVNAFEEYKKKLQSARRHVSGPTLAKLVDDITETEKGVQMAIDDRNDYIQHLVQCVIGGMHVRVNKYEFKQMHLYAASEFKKLQEMVEDDEVHEVIKAEIKSQMKNIQEEERRMRSIGYGTYGLYVEDYEENEMVGLYYFNWLSQAMVLVVEIHKEMEEIYEKEVAAGSEG